MSDQDYLRRAIAIGRDNDSVFDYGAVIVRNSEIIGEDYNHVHQTKDPSAHAEVSALKMACRTVNNHNLGGATLYASHEPCAMCVSCAAWSGVNRIVYAKRAVDEQLGYELRDLGIEEFASRFRGRMIIVEYMPIKEDV